MKRKKLKKEAFAFQRPTLGPKHCLHWLLKNPKRQWKKRGLFRYACERPIKTYHYTKDPEAVDCKNCHKAMEKLSHVWREHRVKKAEQVAARLAKPRPIRHSDDEPSGKEFVAFELSTPSRKIC